MSASARATDAPFGVVEWSLTAVLAVSWGASFLFIRLGLESFGSGLVPPMRIAFGLATLACFSRSRAPVAAADWPRVAALGVLWLAAPFLLFAIAERTVSTAVTGMINGAVPLASAAAFAAMHRRRPSGRRSLALLVGFAGVSVVALAAASGAHPAADTRGLLMLLVAICCYGLSANLAAPLQRKYGAFPVLARAQLVALVVSLPVGLASLPSARFSWLALAAMAVLGAVGTGIAYVILATLVGRTDATRGTIGVFLTPIVAAVLGASLLHEPLTWTMAAGSALVIFGAYLTSTPDGPRRLSSRRVSDRAPDGSATPRAPR